MSDTCEQAAMAFLEHFTLNGGCTGEGCPEYDAFVAAVPLGWSTWSGLRRRIDVPAEEVVAVIHQDVAHVRGLIDGAMPLNEKAQAPYVEAHHALDRLLRLAKLGARSVTIAGERK